MRRFKVLRGLAVLGAAAAIGGAGMGCGARASQVASVDPHDQVSLGAQKYAEHCAGCHGDSGQGDPGPRLVGEGALPLDPPATAEHRKAQFKTVADVYDFVKATMPPSAPGSLSESEYWAILAFDLKANGVDLTGKQLDASTAPSFVLHP